MSSVKTPGPRAVAFKRWMVARETNTKQVAAKSGVTYTTLASFVQGSTRSLKGETEEKIASAYGASVGEIFSGGEAPTSETVPVVGYVGAGAVAHYYATGDGGLDEVPAPKNATANTVAAEIRGESLGPLLDGWLVFYDEVRNPPTEDMIGQLCVVGLPDDRVLVKQLKPSSQPGRFHLLSNNEGPIFDAEITWAALVKSMTPR